VATTTLLTPPPPPVKRLNWLPAAVAATMVVGLVGGYVYFLAGHAKQKLENVVPRQYTSERVLYTAEVVDPPAPPPLPKPQAESRLVQEDPWAKLELENKLKWAQMVWDHKVKLVEASFARSLKLVETRHEERLAALRAPGTVDLEKEAEGKSGNVKEIPSIMSDTSPTGALEAEIARLRQQPLAPQQVQTASYLVPPKSPYTLRQGTHVPVVLDQWMTSDGEGSWVARVEADVWDSVNTQHIIIPAGSTIFGYSEVDIPNNEQPVLMLAAKTLHVGGRGVLPEGTPIDLGRTVGQNGFGVQGLVDTVNKHRIQRYGSAAVLSLITAGVRMAAYNSRGYNDGNGYYLSPSDAAAQGFGDVMGQVVGQELRRTLQIRPTVGVPLGYRFNLTLVQDYDFGGSVGGQAG
jgi:type IV secretory pathway VirB10-like protein